MESIRCRCGTNPFPLARSSSLPLATTVSAGLIHPKRNVRRIVDTRRNSLYISLLFLWLTACSQPVSIEMFAPMGEELVLDMSDSLCTYDISFFTRADFPAFSRRPGRDIPLEVFLTSPSGRTFSEQVYFPTADPIRSTAFSDDYLAPWRTGCDPVEYGKWSLKIRIGDAEWESHLYGFGAILEKKR